MNTIDKLEKVINYDGVKYDCEFYIEDSYGGYSIEYKLINAEEDTQLEGMLTCSNFEKLYESMIDILDRHYETVKHSKFFSDFRNWDGVIK
ncbi:hypothetical protein [Aquibacillus saliphilus]|uniref:hypothetical protein n=1 Tax=Aquibacillus saliphilus TaxID=1909422 RepID=UPI001CF06DDA|nr:hypothetical protein [Aquibacillus saliphilus]